MDGNWRLVCFLAVAGALLKISQFIYRLYFHPLRNIPGPTLAGISTLWEYAVDSHYEGGGRFSFYLQKLHEQYGPIIRIGPDEVHIQDHEWFRVLFTRGKIRDKDWALANAFGSRLGTFGAVKHFTHKRRRAATNTFFSQRSVDNLEHSSRKFVGQLDDFLTAKHHSEENCFDIRPVLLAWGTDSLTGTILGKSRGLLQDETKRQEWYRMYDGMRELWPLVRRCPWIMPTALTWPRTAIPLARVFLPKIEVLLHLFLDMIKLAASKAERTSFAMKNEENHDPPAFQTDVFDAIVRSSLPEAEKQPLRMAHEAAELVAGGGATTAKGICDGLFFVLASKSIYHKLTQELKERIPMGSAIPAARDLQQFPYLNAVIKETLRLSRVVALRSAARAPEEDLYYNGQRLGPDVTVSMTLSTAMTREDIFPSPFEFSPERWLDNPERLSIMEKFFIPFGLGNRSCLGRNFAMMQMHLIFAMFFRRYEARLVDTVRARDIDPHRTWATNEPHPTSTGIKISILAVDQSVSVLGG